MARKRHQPIIDGENTTPLGAGVDLDAMRCSVAYEVIDVTAAGDSGMEFRHVNPTYRVAVGGEKNNGTVNVAGADTTASTFKVDNDETWAGSAIPSGVAQSRSPRSEQGGYGVDAEFVLTGEVTIT